MGRSKQYSCNICFTVMKSDNLKRQMKLHMNRKLHDKPVKKRKLDEFNELLDVIGHKKINSFFCSCNKCIHWEKYEECKICNGENICSNEVMNENYKENNSETDKNNTSDKLLNEQDTNCSVVDNYIV